MLRALAYIDKRPHAARGAHTGFTLNVEVRHLKCIYIFQQLKHFLIDAHKIKNQLDFKTECNSEEKEDFILKTLFDFAFFMHVGNVLEAVMTSLRRRSPTMMSSQTACQGCFLFQTGGEKLDKVLFCITTKTQ